MERHLDPRHTAASTEGGRGMTTPPSPEAVKAAMKCIKLEPMLPKERALIRNSSMGYRWQAGQILAAEVERLRGEAQAMRAALDHIAAYGGSTTDTECGTIPPQRPMVR